MLPSQDASTLCVWTACCTGRILKDLVPCSSTGGPSSCQVCISRALLRGRGSFGHRRLSISKSVAHLSFFTNPAAQQLKPMHRLLACLTLGGLYMLAASEPVPGKIVSSPSSCLYPSIYLRVWIPRTKDRMTRACYSNIGLRAC